MPKLKLPAKSLFDKIKSHGCDIAQSMDLFSPNEDDKESDRDEKGCLPRESSPNQNHSNQMLQRVSALPRTISFSPWLGGDFFLCVSVKEAIDLSPAVPMPSSTCDSFVRVSLQRPGSLPLQEAETRVITRNCFPLWEECLPFPLDHVTEDTSIVLRVMDKDIGHFNSFLGTVSLPVKDALATIQKLDHEKIYRMPLLDRQSQARKRGELVFGVAVVAKQEYKEMRGFISSLQDPDTVHDSLQSYCLHAKLHCLKELGGLAAGLLPTLVVEVSVCSCVIRQTLSGQLVGGELDPEGLEVVVPLGTAFRGGDTLKGKDRQQFGEVKVELVAGRTRLAKTQVPIWDVPVRPEGGTAAAAAGADSDSETEGERERVGGGGGISSGRPERRSPGPTATAAIRVVSPESRTPTKAGVGIGIGATSAKVRTRSPDAPPMAPKAAAATGIGGAGEGGAMGSGLARAAELAVSAASATRRISENGSQAPSVGGKDESSKGSPGSGAGAAAPSGGGGPRAPWDGKCYTRRMERLGSGLTRAPLAVLSMQLVKAAPGEANDGGDLASTSIGGLSTTSAGIAAVSGAGGDVFDVADVDTPPEPLAVPDFPGGQSVADFVVGLGPLALLRVLWAEGAEVAQRVWQLEKVTGMKISPWGPDPEGKALCVRSLSYMKPTPVGMTPVQSEQKVMVRHAGGFVVHQFVKPNVPPVGQCVRVFVLIVGQHAGPNKTRLSASVKLEWLKSGMMVSALKGKVEDGTPKDTRRFFETTKSELATKYTVEGAAAAGVATAASGGGSSAAAVADVSIAAAAAGDFAAGGTAAASVAAAVSRLHLLESSLLPVTTVVMAGAVLLVLLLVTSLLRLRSELGRSQVAIQGLAGELAGVAQALEALAQRLPPLLLQEAGGDAAGAQAQ